MTVATPTLQAMVISIVSPITTLYTLHGEGDPSAAAPP